MLAALNLLVLVTEALRSPPLTRGKTLVECQLHFFRALSRTVELKGGGVGSVTGSGG